MANFTLYGTIIEEPKLSQTKTGLEYNTVVIEERQKTAYNEKINVFNISFFGKAMNCIPKNVSLRGAVAIVSGELAAREYNGRLYVDLRGISMSVVASADLSVNVNTPEQASIETPEEEDDDLPF